MCHDPAKYSSGSGSLRGLPQTTQAQLNLTLGCATLNLAPQAIAQRPGCGKPWFLHMGLSENSVPLNPMVLLIIIPMKNGYFIGNIPHFQTYPHQKSGLPADFPLNQQVRPG